MSSPYPLSRYGDKTYEVRAGPALLPQGADHLPRSAGASASTGLRRIDLFGEISDLLCKRELILYG